MSPRAAAGPSSEAPPRLPPPPHLRAPPPRQPGFSGHPHVGRPFHPPAPPSTPGLRGQRQGRARGGAAAAAARPSGAGSREPRERAKRRCGRQPARPTSCARLRTERGLRGGASSIAGCPSVTRVDRAGPRGGPSSCTGFPLVTRANGAGPHPLPAAHWPPRSTGRGLGRTQLLYRLPIGRSGTRRHRLIAVSESRPGGGFRGCCQARAAVGDACSGLPRRIAPEPSRAAHPSRAPLQPPP